MDEIAKFFEDVDPANYIDCPRCGQHKIAHATEKHLCVDCVRTENVRLTYYRQHQDNWMEISKESGLDVWEQQPGETQWEFTIWTAFRDSYPGKKATYPDVARQLMTTVGVVKHVAQRWTFQARMQAWMKHCDEITLAQRRVEILAMNKQHISMAEKINKKLETAIDNIDEYNLKPGELASLAKVATELERKARINTVDVETELREAMSNDDNPNIKKSPTKQQDLAEVVQILLKAGALGDITQIAVRQTTEVALVDSEGKTARTIDE